MLTGETRGLAKDSLAVGIGLVLGQVSMLVVLALVGQVMGVAELGRLALITGFVAFIGSFIDVRTELAVVTIGARNLHEHSRFSSLVRLAYTIDLGTGVVAFFVVLALFPVLGTRIIGPDALVPTVLYATTLLVSFGDNTAKALLRLFGNFRVLAVFGGVQALLRVGGVALALAGGGTLTRVVLAFVAVDLIGALMMPVLTHRTYRRTAGRPLGLRRADIRLEARDVWKTVFHTNLVGYAKAFHTRVPTLLLGLFESAATVGLYRVASLLASAVAIPTDPVVGAIHPRLATLWARGAAGEIRKLTAQVTLISAAPLFLFSVGIFVLRDPLLGLFGAIGSPAATAVLLLALGGTLVNAVLFWNSSLLLATGQSKALARISVIGVFVVELPLLVALVPPFGMLGAAVSFLIPVLATNAWVTVRAVRTLRDDRSSTLASSAAEAPRS